MARVPAFQAGHAGSIPVTRSDPAMVDIGAPDQNQVRVTTPVELSSVRVPCSNVVRCPPGTANTKLVG